MQHEQVLVGGVGLTRFEFEPGELRWVGSDYGTAYVEGTTPEARRTFDTINEAARRGGDSIKCHLLVTVPDREAAQREDWHAGRERTPQAGVDAGAAEQLPTVAGGTTSGDPDGEAATG